MNHDQLRDLLPLNALDRLEPEEAQQLNEHLESGCPECEAELVAFREALSAFAIAATGDQKASASDRILRMIEQRLQSSQTSFTRRGGRGVDGRMRPSTTVNLSIAAAALVIVALGLTILRLERSLQDVRVTTSAEVAMLRTRVDYLQQGVDSTSGRLLQLKAQLSLTSNLTLAALSPDTEIVHLKGLAAAPEASAVLALSPGNRTAFMQVSGLPDAPSGKIYEVWWIGRHTGPIRAGLFAVPIEGTAKVQLTMPPQGEEFVASAVTLEPEGGTERPTGAMYLKGEFPRLQSQKPG